MKDPYILNLSNLKESFIETELEKAMVERIKTVLLELGNGFSFIGNQYRIEVDGDEYFIDMLFVQRNLSSNTLYAYKNDLQNFSRWLERRHYGDINDRSIYEYFFICRMR